MFLLMAVDIFTKWAIVAFQEGSFSTYLLELFACGVPNLLAH
jgi:hypothetical protein